MIRGGNTPRLENGNLNLEDKNKCKIGDEIIRVIDDGDRLCKDLGLLPEDPRGFVEYLWDDPTDDIDPIMEEGKSPGDVPKLSYVVSFSDDSFLGGENLIIGAGFHTEVSSDDDGCAIAGSGNTCQRRFV